MAELKLSVQRLKNKLFRDIHEDSTPEETKETLELFLDEMMEQLNFKRTHLIEQLREISWEV